LIKFREQLEKYTETMLEYARVILPKVSFSRELFRKELVKCINWVGDSEVNSLKEWCIENFMEMYPDILAEAFKLKAAV
jgi:hypothetical protein